MRLEPSVERFVDLRLGPQEQRPSEQCGDLLVRDRDGNWTYQFAATVDDYVQGVTLVIRGVDLLASTGRQIQLARLLGRAEPPAFLHHPLIMKSPGAEAEQVGRRHRHPRAAGARLDAAAGDRRRGRRNDLTTNRSKTGAHRRFALPAFQVRRRQLTSAGDIGYLYRTPMAQRTELLKGTLDLLILKTLELEARHGIGVAERMEQITRGAFSVKPGSLFPALHRLEAAGSIAGEWTASGRRPAREVVPAHRRRAQAAGSGEEAMGAGRARRHTDSRGVRSWTISTTSCAAISTA